ncbi:DUF3800 domain-containing protein [Haloferax volcanii]|uniref:DUF3800 domain-containing protein n=3 Tax=Haloferax volcanii TaxID=2246 RepID=A0A384L958_HALVD|nr:DUF3800 domain-containing protein [Haloferax volcanii]ADE04088.1 DUF3800 domain protein [Haloferax volcanii DS2]ELY24596.1 hypothetical protein C498_18115 [Haloferax volcanii DS2]MBS8118846.1 DUF3800 domain-containing protein [Haloferax volcanii]MBS8123860.1 DUF3800 domain-containing protein [Haloferax volcanii]MBS8127729.1 DUF3800 domain-containing protein [Haloferax volcanii]
MTRILYFFVDESGNADAGTGFSIVGCWCVSKRSSEYEVLASTKGFLLEQARRLRDDDDFSEIKSSKLHPSYVDDLMQAMVPKLHSDKTIETPRVWTTGQPIRYSAYTTLPDITRGAFDGRTSGSFSNGQMIRSMSLISAISPLFQEGLMNLDVIDEINVVLDDTVWDAPADVVGGCFDSHEEIGVPTTFTTQDSRSVPGLQIADLAAYSWPRNQRKGDCAAASNVVRDHRL